MYLPGDLHSIPQPFQQHFALIGHSKYKKIIFKINKIFRKKAYRNRLDTESGIFHR